MMTTGSKQRGIADEKVSINDHLFEEILASSKDGVVNGERGLSHEKISFCTALDDKHVEGDGGTILCVCSSVTRN